MNYKDKTTYKGFIASKMIVDPRFPRKERCYLEIINYFLKQGSNDETMRNVKNMYRRYKEEIK
jgi:uncharacterized protein YozE (UPF0346 family)